MNEQLTKLLSIPPDLMEEIAIVPCGGCSRGHFSISPLYQLQPLAEFISLQSLVKGAHVSRRRLECAHAVIGLSACQQACVPRLINSIRQLDAHFNVAHFSSIEQLIKTLRKELERLRWKSVDSETLGQTFEFNCVGWPAPRPLLELSKLLDDIQEGDAVHVTADQENFIQEIQHLCAQREIILDEYEVKGSITKALIRIPFRSIADETLDADFHPKTPSFSQMDGAIEYLDCTGLKCPMPIVKISTKVKAMKGIGQLEILADDPAFPADVQAWAKQANAQIKWLDDSNPNIFHAILILGQSSKEEISTSKILPQTKKNPLQELPKLAHIDALDLRSPLQIVKLQREVNRHSTPGLISIETKDQNFKQDIENWCLQTNNRLVSLNLQGDILHTVVAINLAHNEEQHSSHSSPDSPSASLPSHSEQPITPSTLFQPEKEGVHIPTQQLETLDFTGLRCPMPILKLNKALRGKKTGHYRLLADDPAFASDLRAWCEQNEVHVNSIQKEDNLITAIISLDPEDSELLELNQSDIIPSTPSQKLPMENQTTPLTPQKTSTSSSLPPQSETPIDLFAQTQRQVPNPNLQRPVKVEQKRPPNLHSLKSEPTEIQKNPASLSEFQRQKIAPKTSAPPSPKSSTTSSAHSQGTTLDFRGLKCPMPIVHLSRHVNKQPDELLHIIADDPAFPADLRAWCEVNKFDLLDEQKEERTYTITIRRQKR